MSAVYVVEYVKDKIFVQLLTADVKCSISDDRTKCGFPEASHYACVKRGCCFDSHGDPTKKPWCFYPSGK